MEDHLEILLDKYRALERELLAELQKKEQEFHYHVYKNRVRFEREVKARHRLLMMKISKFIAEARPMVVLTAPVIWSCVFPAMFMDLVVSVYQAICFPVYGIPKVRRGDYIVADRHYLSYLNFIEKLNCVYCAYFNGLIAYVREVAARTEQHWCPIKHARRVRDIHSRYKYFLDYGDAEGYRKRIDSVRTAFNDLQNSEPNATPEAPPQKEE